MADAKAKILVVFYSRDGSVKRLPKRWVKELVRPGPRCCSAACPISFLRP